MNAIIGMGDYERFGLLSKDVQVFYNKPLIKYILDELYSYQEYIDNIIIVVSNTEYFNSLINIIEKDKLFLRKIHIVEDSLKTLFSNLDTGYTYIKENNIESDSILFWSGTELLFKTRKFSDPRLSSFRCYSKSKEEIIEELPNKTKIIYDSKTRTFKLIQVKDVVASKDILYTDSNNYSETYNISIEDNVIQNNSLVEFKNLNTDDYIEQYTGHIFNVFKFNQKILDNILPNNEYESLDELLFDYNLKDPFYKLNEFAFSFSLISLDYENDFKQYIAIKNISSTDLLIDIDFLNDSITKTNKYSLLPYSRDIVDNLKDIQSKLFNESSILSKYNERQKIYTPKILDIDITRGGDYIDYITEEFIPGPTLDNVLLYGKLSDSQISKCVLKIINVIENVYHTNVDYTNYDVYIRSLEDKQIKKYLTEKKEYYKSIASYYKTTYSPSNIEEYGFVFDSNTEAKWNLFIESVFSEYEKDCSSENIISQGVFQRYIHGNLLFSSIKYNQDYNRIYFINQNFKCYSICDLNDDYVDLLVSTYMNLHALENGLYTEDNSIIKISSEVTETTMKYLSVLEENVSNIDKLKLLSIVKLFEYPYKNQLPNNIVRAIINYSTQNLDARMSF